MSNVIASGIFKRSILKATGRATTVNCPMIGGDRLFTRPRSRAVLGTGYHLVVHLCRPHRPFHVLASPLFQPAALRSRKLRNLGSRIIIGAFYLGERDEPIGARAKRCWWA